MNQPRYYLQPGKTPSVRRYDEHGNRERWTGFRWSPECASEEACRLTRDQRITEAEAMKITEAK